jgi:hypothetical protein
LLLYLSRLNHSPHGSYQGPGADLFMAECGYCHTKPAQTFLFIYI